MLDELLRRYPELKNIENEIVKAEELMYKTVKNGGKILVCGNGGSCADADHIVGELMKGFLSKRPINSEFKDKLDRLYPNEAEFLGNHLQETVTAISLNSHPALSSAFINDVSPEMVYAQLVYGYGNEGDLFIGISTSGNSVNVVNAAKIARAKGLSTMALTGRKECLLDMCDSVLKAPETETFKVQEYHLPLYHYLCAAVEERMF